MPIPGKIFSPPRGSHYAVDAADPQKSTRSFSPSRERCFPTRNSLLAASRKLPSPTLNCCVVLGFESEAQSPNCPLLLKRISVRHAGYSAVRTLEPTRQWFGFRPGIEHSGPAIRRITGTNLWLAYGHYRNGILLTPATAQLVASEILRSGNRTQASSPARLKQTSLASEESVTGILDVPNADVPTFPRTT